MTEPTKEIWLQFYGEGTKADMLEGADIDSSDVTWSADQIHDSDIRYVIDKRYKPPKKEKP